MFNLLALYCTVEILFTFHVYSQSDNNVDNDDEDLNRYFKDDNFKPALFGSSSYDPIKEVFEPLRHPKYKNDTAGSTIGVQDETAHDGSTHAPEHHPPEHHPPEHHPPEHHPPEHHPPEHHPPEHHPPEHHPPEHHPPEEHATRQRQKYSPYFFRQSTSSVNRFVLVNYSSPTPIL